eukprot:3887388-Amphidinium_carterae.1
MVFVFKGPLGGEVVSVSHRVALRANLRVIRVLVRMVLHRQATVQSLQPQQECDSNQHKC